MDLQAIGGVSGTGELTGGLTTRWSRPPFGWRLSSVPLGRFGLFSVACSDK